MPTELKKLEKKDREVLLRAPAIVALIAAVSDDGIVSESEKAESIKLAHLRTYSSPEILHNYYKQVDKVFAEYLQEEYDQLPESWEEKEKHLEERLTSIKDVLPKLNEVYAKELVISLKSFARHVFRSNDGYLEHFLMPIFMNKIERDSFTLNLGK